jgi:hypothetical protein
MNKLESYDYVITRSVTERSALIELLNSNEVNVPTDSKTWLDRNSDKAYTLYPVIFFSKDTNIIRGRRMANSWYNELSIEDFLIKAGVTQEYGKGRSYQGSIIKFNFI